VEANGVILILLKEVQLKNCFLLYLEVGLRAKGDPIFEIYETYYDGHIHVWYLGFFHISFSWI